MSIEDEVATLRRDLTDVEESLRLLRNADRLQGRRVSAAAPSDEDRMGWNATTKKWEPKAGVRGVLAETLSTSMTIDATTSELDCLTLAAITGDGVRRMRLTVFSGAGTDTVANVLELFLKEGDTTLSTARHIFATSGGSGQVALVILYELVPSDASHTYKFTVDRVGGTGISQAFGNATRPAFIMCEDIGT